MHAAYSHIFRYSSLVVLHKGHTSSRYSLISNNTVATHICNTSVHPSGMLVSCPAAAFGTRSSSELGVPNASLSLTISSEGHFENPGVQHQRFTLAIQCEGAADACASIAPDYGGLPCTSSGSTMMTGIRYDFPDGDFMLRGSRWDSGGDGCNATHLVGWPGLSSTAMNIVTVSSSSRVASRRIRVRQTSLLFSDIVGGHSSHIFQLCTTPHAPCDVTHFVSMHACRMLIGARFSFSGALGADRQVLLLQRHGPLRQMYS